MARQFTAASSQYGLTGSAFQSGAPFSVSAWYYGNSVPGTSQTIFALSDAASADYFILRVIGDNSATLNISAVTADQFGGSGHSDTTGGFAVNTWVQAGAVFASSTSRTAYLNGVAATTDVNSATPSGVNQTSVGALDFSGGSIIQFLDGRAAEIGVWNVALTTAEMAILATGVSPLFVRPQSLVLYFPLMGQNSPETSKISATTLTLTNAPTAAGHSRVYNKVAPNRSWASHRLFTQVLTATQAQTATLARSLVHSLTLTATQAQVATLSTVKTFFRTLSATQAQVATLGTAVTRIKTLTATAITTVASIFADKIAKPSTTDNSAKVLTGLTVNPSQTGRPGKKQPFRIGDWLSKPKTVDTLEDALRPRFANADTMFEELYSRTAPATTPFTTVPTTIKGQVWSVELDGLSALTTFGLVVRNGIGDYVTRRIIAGSGIVVTNGSGTAGDLTLSVSGSTGGILGVATGGTGANLSATGGANQVVKQSSVGGAFTVGTLDAASIATGILALARGGTGADLSATGGANQVLLQSSVGGVVTVNTISSAVLTDSANLPKLNAGNVFSSTMTVQGLLTASGNISTVALTASGNVTISNSVSGFLQTDNTGLVSATATPATGSHTFYVATVSGGAVTHQMTVVGGVITVA